MKIIELDQTDSTNEYCKRLGLGNVIVTARIQTAGRGTKGRSFSSGEGGLYFSAMYTGGKNSNALQLLVNRTVAVCKTLERFGLKPAVKWVNDVLVGGKKISGTLTENVICGNNIVRSIVGTGINVLNDLPPELKDVATSFKLQLKNPPNVEEVKNVLFALLDSQYTIDDYKSYIDWFGKPILLKMENGAKKVLALDVDGDLRLVVSDGKNIQKISAGEVSLILN